MVVLELFGVSEGIKHLGILMYKFSFRGLELTQSPPVGWKCKPASLNQSEDKAQ